MITPRNEYVLIERIDPLQSGLITIPEVAQEKSLLGKVLAVGSGKREPSESYKMGVIWTPDENGIQQASGGQWVEFPSHLQADSVQPGDIVYLQQSHGRSWPERTNQMTSSTIATCISSWRTMCSSK